MRPYVLWGKKMAEQVFRQVFSGDDFFFNKKLSTEVFILDSLNYLYQICIPFSPFSLHITLICSTTLSALFQSQVGFLTCKNLFLLGISERGDLTYLAYIPVLLLLLFYIGVYLIYNVVLVSFVQCNESAMHISTRFQIFPHRPLQSLQLLVVYSRSLLSILCIVMCICQSQSPSLSLLPPLHTSAFNFTLFLMRMNLINYTQKTPHKS